MCDSDGVFATTISSFMVERITSIDTLVGEFEDLLAARLRE
jgi:hypothetical protein